jgi:hypothetical protein
VTDDRSRVVLARLKAIDWTDDAAAYVHANSRALLMREYLRRTAVWARAYDLEASWPFLDLAQLVAPEVELAPEVATELEEALMGVAPSSLKRTCRAAVRWAALNRHDIREGRCRMDRPGSGIATARLRPRGRCTGRVLSVSGGDGIRTACWPTRRRSARTGRPSCRTGRGTRAGS